MARSVSTVAVASRLGGGVLSHFQYTPCIVISSSTGYSNPRSPGDGGARCNWRHATRPMPPSRSSERRSFASRSSGGQISSCVMPRPELAGVSVGPRVARPYFVEIWPEKTTVNDVLMPLAYQDGLNIIPASGETSALRCRELADRANAAERGSSMSRILIRLEWACPSRWHEKSNMKSTAAGPMLRSKCDRSC